MIFHGNDVRSHDEFLGTVSDLAAEVLRLREADPEGYRSHPRTRLLARIVKIIRDDVPANPTSAMYLQGNTLGEKYREWKRAKFERYRLFFKYSRNECQIVNAWVNTDTCLRKAGSKTDVYTVFKSLLDRKIIPNEFKELSSSSVCPWEAQVIPEDAIL